MQQTFALRQIMLSKLGRLTEKTSTELFIDVRNDYGSVCERRLFRTLSWLLDNGHAKFDFSDEQNDAHGRPLRVFLNTGKPITEMTWGGRVVQLEEVLDDEEEEEDLEHVAA